MKLSTDSKFQTYYERHCKHLKLKGLQPKTIEAYSRAIRRIGAYFNGDLDDLTQNQLLDYFYQLKETASWSTVKLDLYGLKFFYTYVLKKNWIDIPLVKSPKVSRIPDIVTIDEAYQLFKSTHKLSYRVLFYTLYSMGFAWARDFVCKPAILTPADNECIFVTPKETKIVWCLYRQKHYKF